MTKPPAACLIGWPAAHSRSPLIHHYWLRTLGIEGGYVIEAVPPDEFKDFVFRLSLRGFVGANVTIPHKERALALSKPDDARPRGRRRQYAVVRERRAVLDQHRRRRLYQQSRRLRARMGRVPRMRWCSAPAAAARAVVFGLIERGIKRVHLANRTVERAQRAGGSIRRERSARGVGCDRRIAAARRAAGEHDLARHARPAARSKSMSAGCRRTPSSPISSTCRWKRRCWPPRARAG